MAPDTPPQRSENQEESDSERPRKRARRTSDPAELPTLAPPASTSPPPTLPTAFLPIHHPSHYTPPGAPPTAFQLPTHLTSFSYSPTRELLMGARKDEAIAHYAEPRLGADLNTGFEECVWRDDTVDEGLDSLLDTLSNFEEDDSTGAARDILERNHVVTWRGMITKFMLAAYEFESANRGRADGWEMNAMVIDGTLYLEEAKSPAKIAAKSASESSYKLQSYYGYAFEAFSTVPPPPEPLPTTFVSPNTNVQWCSVVKTNLGGFRTILGGEVDCVLPTANMRRITTEDFVELKTNMTINSPRDEVNFERLKLLKHYTQSFLLGVPRVIVGFRTRQGQLTALQTFKTLEMPRLVRGKPHGWDPLACLSSAQKLLSFTFKSIKSNNAQLEYQAIFNDLSSSDSLEAVKAWPVFRLSFSPTGHDAGISLRQLSEEEVKTEVIEGKKKDDRVGFLLERWVAGVKRRKTSSPNRPLPEQPKPIPPPSMIFKR